jgi:hypothetical protein
VRTNALVEGCSCSRASSKASELDLCRPDELADVTPPQKGVANATRVSSSVGMLPGNGSEGDSRHTKQLSFDTELLKV